MQNKCALYLGFSSLVTLGSVSDTAAAANVVRSTGILVAARQAPQTSSDSLAAWIDSVRRQHNIPALGAIVFRSDTILALAVAGVRRSNSSAPVERQDRFQLGSNTKAITATVLATLVEDGKLTWTKTVAEIF